MTTATSLYGQSLYDLAAEEGLSEEILKQMDDPQKRTSGAARRSIQGPAASVSAEFLDDPA